MKPIGVAALLFVLLGLGIHPSSGQPIDDHQLLRAIDALQAPLRDFYCEYEGERLEDKEVVGNESGRYRLYSGKFKFKQYDKFINNIYNDFLATRINPQRRLSTETLLATEAKFQVFNRADGATGGGLTRHVTASDLDITGSYGRIFLVRCLRELLKYSKKRLVYEGTEEIDGAPCERYAIVLGREPYPIETGLVDRFWIDMGRNGHVLRHEEWNKGQLLTTASEIVLEDFGVGGDTIWLPVSGTVKSVDGDVTNSVENYRVLHGSVKINRGIRDAEFSIKYPVGTPISDHLRGVVYEFGQDRRPPPEDVTDAQARLQEALRKAQDTRSELVAASWSRGGWTNWAFWAPFSVFLAGALATVALSIARARRAR